MNRVLSWLLAGSVALGGAGFASVSTGHTSGGSGVWQVAQNTGKAGAAQGSPAGDECQRAEKLLEQARREMADAGLLDPAGRRRSRRMEAARAVCREAETILAASAERLDAALAKLPRFIDPKDKPKVQERDQLRRSLLQTQLALAGAAMEIARTYPPGEPENKANLAGAAKQYGAIFDKHHNDLAGLYARLGQARCWKELGQTDQAMAVFVELLSQPDGPEALAVLKNQTTLAALETALLPGVGKPREALAIYKAWQASPSAVGQSSDGAVAAIRYLAGEAAWQYARSLRADDQEQAALRRECLHTAQEAFAAAAAEPGPYQAKAKARLSDPLLGAPATKLPPPTTFADARDRATAALERLALAEDEEKPVKGRPETPRLVAARREAIRACTLAMELRDDNVPMEDLLSLHYELAYLDYKEGKLREAAELGEDVARQDPDHPKARQAAAVAMAACATLFNQADDDPKRQAAKRRMLAVARLIAERWEGEPEASDAWMVLLQDAIADGRLEKAAACLEHVPPASPRRSEAELALGRAMWQDWVEAWRLSAPERPSQGELDQLLDQARNQLMAGVEGAKRQAGKGVSPAVAASILDLARLELAAGRPEKAAAWLDDAAIRSTKGLKKNNPPGLEGDSPIFVGRKSGQSPGEWREELAGASMLVYIAAQRWQDAEAALRDMEPADPQDRQSAGRAIRAILRTADELTQWLQRLRRQERTAELADVRACFGRFLWQVTDRPQGNTFFSLAWAAEAYAALGAAVTDMGNSGNPWATEKPSEKAVACWRQAAETYQRVFKLCETEKEFTRHPGLTPHPDAVAAMKVRWAGCLRRSGDCEAALKILVALLQEHPAMVDAQVEAAYTYQSWAAEKPNCLLLAIAGSRKYPEVWGWGEISRRLAGAAEFRDAFCEARYNLALCRCGLAWAARDPQERAELLARAEEDILTVARLRPDMGGKSWYDKYEALVRAIRNSRD